MVLVSALAVVAGCCQVGAPLVVVTVVADWAVWLGWLVYCQQFAFFDALKSRCCD